MHLFRWPRYLRTNSNFKVTGLQIGKDTLPEWSKGVDSSSTSASCVGSNPTGVISAEAMRAAAQNNGKSC